MATSKPAIVKSEGDRPAAISKITGTWENFTHFLSDVRAEMRKVVTPSRKEVQATTTVVIIAVFLFGLYFFIIDRIFALGLDRLLKSLAGAR
jgi:preprotein translocase subunit SecE